MHCVACNVMQTVYHNVVQCLQNVKHNVEQAIVDNITLNLPLTVIQCRPDVVHYVVHSSVQPVVHNVAQNVRKIHNALR